jgi:hypothetical protein
MIAEPVTRVRRAAGELLTAGATLIAGHSAHVFHGAAPGVLFDLGDFLDDYIVHPQLRNDLGLLWFIELGRDGARRIEALPLALDHCFTRQASQSEARSIVHLLQERCAPFNTTVETIADGLIELHA